MTHSCDYDPHWREYWLLKIQQLVIFVTYKNRGRAFTSSHRSNRCYVAILISNKCVELPTLATILQVAFLSFTGMLTVMTNCLPIEAKFMLHTSKSSLNRPHCTFSYSLRLKAAAYIQKYAEIAYQLTLHDALYKANDIQVILRQSWSSSLSVKPNSHRRFYFTWYVLSMCTKTTFCVAWWHNIPC